MSGHAQRGGWTLVEFTVAMASATVLALTAGAMLVFTFQSWRRHVALTDMQEDLRIAGVALCSSIREARNTEIALPASNRLIAGRKSVYQADGALAYSANGQWLALDPNTNAANDGVALCRGRVATFQCARGTNSVSFRLELQDQGETIVATNVIFLRN
jgi:hypothetical protein